MIVRLPRLIPVRKYLSQLLIAVLLLVAPLSFSTQRVPDFKPPCEVTVVETGERSAVQAQYRGDSQSCADAATLPSYTFFPPRSCAAGTSLPFSAVRAPPA